MKPETDPNIEWDKLPATVESSAFRKTSDDYTFTLATERKHQDLINAFLRRMSTRGVVFFVPCTSDEQIEALLRDAENVGANGRSPLLPGPRPQDPGPGSCIVSVETLAAAFGLDPRTVQLDAEKGLLIRNRKGEYDTLASCVALRKAVREAESGQNDVYNDERTKAIRLKRMERELEYHERAGNLVNAAAVRSVIEKAKAAEKQQVLFMPKQLAPRLEGDPAVNEAILEEWAYSFLKGQTEINITADVTPAPDVDKMPELKKRKKRRKGKK